jgi:hypothetical protein
MAILQQTEAMLQQKLVALKDGVTVQYTVDGRAFSRPASAMQVLANVERESGISEAKIKAQEAEVARLKRRINPSGVSCNTGNSAPDVRDA